MPYCRNCGYQMHGSDLFCEDCRDMHRKSSTGMEYLGKTCPYCQYPIKQDSDVKVCLSCKVPHHQECWEENGGCTTYGCQGIEGSTSPEGRLEISLNELENTRIEGSSSLEPVGSSGVFKYPKANLGKRVLAMLVDLFVMFVPIILVILVLMMF